MLSNMADQTTPERIFKIVLNASGPLGLAATLLGWIKPIVGYGVAIVGFSYIAWELWELVRSRVKRTRMALIACVIGGMIVGGLFGLLLYRTLSNPISPTTQQAPNGAPSNIPAAKESPQMPSDTESKHK